ncbi:tetratricopeptide repeat protein [Novosphingobium pokkalii]|uniref:Tetratricopeptide repeat protein n=1 Tax=Novosphingobium pokkalii TaxID=1770194 RepID=A0ABV7V442_9SPHN|nr:tetratricopeptide repeat protein [Novosphingobium pokkalii]
MIRAVPCSSRPCSSWPRRPGRATLLASALALVFAVAGCGDSPARHADKARSAFAAQDFGSARVEALAALDAGKLSMPDTRDLLRLLARAQLQLGDGDGAQSTLARLEEAGAKGPAVNRMKAEAALLRGLPRQALTLLGQDGDADAWRLRAAAQQALGDNAQALSAFRQGMAAGDNAQLARDYARFLITAEDYPAAEQVLAVMQRLDPKGLDTAMVEGALRVKQGQLDAAATAYDRAIAAYPARIEPLIERANLADMQGKLDQAIGLIGKAARLAPGDSRVLDLQVQFASEKGDWDKVRQLLAPHEVDLDPRTPNGLTYAEALLRLGHPEQARVMFARALLLSPQNPYSRMMLAEAQLATGDPATALRTVRPLSDSRLAGPRELDLALRAARAAGDPAADTLAARTKSAQWQQDQKLAADGQAALGLRDWAGAIAAYSALLGEGGDAEVLKRLALACSNAGQHHEAIAYADRALLLAPRDPDMLHMAGLARLNAGQEPEAAQRLLQRAVDADPANRLFRADLARAQAR